MSDWFQAPLRLPVPEHIRLWASDWAEINEDVAVETLNLSSDHRLDSMPGVSLYGGTIPIMLHRDRMPDEVTEDFPEFPVWGFILSCPEASLIWNHGSAPIGSGSAYSINPMELHGVQDGQGPIAFIANFSYDPRPAFGSLERFAHHALKVACALYDAQPDPIRFVEEQAGLAPGELG